MKKLNIGLLALLFIALITVGATTGISGPKTIWGKISDTVARAIRIDSATHVIETIEHEHSKIHSGSSYVCTDVQHVDATTQKWMVLTPDSTEYAHMLFSAACTGEMQMDVTEHSDSTGTTVLFIANRRRIIPTTSASVVVFRGVTGGTIDLATGTLVAYAYKAPLESVPLLLSTSDTIDIKATTDIADVNISSGVIEVNVLVMSTAASGFPQ